MTSIPPVTTMKESAFIAGYAFLIAACVFSGMVAVHFQHLSAAPILFLAGGLLGLTWHHDAKPSLSAFVISIISLLAIPASYVFSACYDPLVDFGPCLFLLCTPLAATLSATEIYKHGASTIRVASLSASVGTMVAGGAIVLWALTANGG